MDLALFDFDGTLTRGNTYTPFLRVASEPARRRQARWRYLPHYLAYRAGLLSGKAIRERVTRFVLGGRDAAAIHALGERYAREVLPGELLPEAMARVDWHRKRGDRIVVVSASLDVYLAPWCRAQGLELLCSELEVRDGLLTGEYVGGDCSGPAKAVRVHERYRLSDYATVHAYGDTVEDRELLALAHRRVFRGRELAVA